jgi:hypothetical protein
MSREDEASRVPDLLLERYRLGELPPGEVERLEWRLKGDAELRQRLQALERSDQEIRRQYPSEWLAERVRTRLDARRPAPPNPNPAWSWHWPVPAALAVAATVLFVLAPRTFGPPPAGPVPALRATLEPGDRIKGLRPALVLFRKTAAGTEALADGAVARAGDLIRVGYRSAGRPYGVILSIDGRGAVTLHVPKQGQRAAALRSGDTVLLDHAYELDDAPRFERFFFVTAPAPFDVAPVLAAARRAGAGGPPPTALVLPPPLEQLTFSLEKEVRQ